MIFDLMDDLFIELEDEEQEEWAPEPLYIEAIRPQDVPERDSPFPTPPPNKRVIIIDI